MRVPLGLMVACVLALVVGFALRDRALALRRADVVTVSVP